MRRETASAFVDERRKRMEQVTWGDAKWACIVEEVSAVSMSGSNLEQ